MAEEGNWVPLAGNEYVFVDPILVTGRRRNPTTGEYSYFLLGGGRTGIYADESYGEAARERMEGLEANHLQEYESDDGRVRFFVDADISREQGRVIQEIVEYVNMMSVQESGTKYYNWLPEIKVTLVQQAFYESSLGQITNNSANSNVVGLYQYNVNTWAQFHSDKDINNRSDQIRAMYQDLIRYVDRYEAGQANGSIPSNLSYDDYVETKHHGGENSTDWYEYQAGYHASNETLNYNPIS